MRRLQAIALVIALMAAPMVLFAGAWKCACAPAFCTMACCNHGKCMMQRHEQCQGSATAITCDCMHFPPFAMLAPLTQMILPHSLPAPSVERTAREFQATAPDVLPGFLPPTFHPPRG